MEDDAKRGKRLVDHRSSIGAEEAWRNVQSNTSERAASVSVVSSRDISQVSIGQ